MFAQLVALLGGNEPAAEKVALCACITMAIFLAWGIGQALRRPAQREEQRMGQNLDFQDCRESWEKEAHRLKAIETRSKIGRIH